MIIDDTGIQAEVQGGEGKEVRCLIAAKCWYLVESSKVEKD